MKEIKLDIKKIEIIVFDRLKGLNNDLFIENISKEIALAVSNNLHQLIKRKDTVKDFHGAGYDKQIDLERLTRKMKRIYDFVKRGGWYTLIEISQETGVHSPSASAYLRYFRRPKYGSNIVLRRPRERQKGIFEYKFIRGDKNDREWKGCSNQHTRAIARENTGHYRANTGFR